MKTIKLIVCALACSVSLVACNNSEETNRQTDGQTEVAKPHVAKSIVIPKMVETVEAKWARTCALCHVTGVGGAPRIGISAEWQPRLAQGKELLLTHTIDGYNDMPPLGYCMSCDREDFSSLIDFMAGETQ